MNFIEEGRSHLQPPEGDASSNASLTPDLGDPSLDAAVTPPKGSAEIQTDIRIIKDSSLEVEAGVPIGYVSVEGFVRVTGISRSALYKNALYGLTMYKFPSLEGVSSRKGFLRAEDVQPFQELMALRERGASPSLAVEIPEGYISIPEARSILGVGHKSFYSHYRNGLESIALGNRVFVSRDSVLKVKSEKDARSRLRARKKVNKLPVTKSASKQREGSRETRPPRLLEADRPVEILPRDNPFLRDFEQGPETDLRNSQTLQLLLRKHAAALSFDQIRVINLAVETPREVINSDEKIARRLGLPPQRVQQLREEAFSNLQLADSAKRIRENQI